MTFDTDALKKEGSYGAVLGIEIVLEVDDVDAIYARVQREKWTIADALAQRPWGLRDFRVLDPNGFYIRVTGIN